VFLDPGSEIRDPEWVKIRIRDKHPGSATLKKELMHEGSWNLIHHLLSTYIAEVINTFKANNYTTGVTVSYRQYCN
jgi:hypothetical protein